LRCGKSENIEALAEFEKACHPPSEDVNRIISEESREGGDLWPLLTDPRTKAKVETLIAEMA
jgi:hypothetical protein